MGSARPRRSGASGNRYSDFSVPVLLKVRSAASLPSRDGKGRVFRNVSFQVFRGKAFTFQNSNEFPYVKRTAFKRGGEAKRLLYGVCHAHNEHVTGCGLIMQSPRSPGTSPL